MIDVSEPERDEVGDVPAAHEVHDPLVGEGVRLGAAVVIFEERVNLVLLNNFFSTEKYDELYIIRMLRRNQDFHPMKGFDLSQVGELQGRGRPDQH